MQKTNYEIHSRKDRSAIWKIRKIRHLKMYFNFCWFCWCNINLLFIILSDNCDECSFIFCSFCYSSKYTPSLVFLRPGSATPTLKQTLFRSLVTSKILPNLAVSISPLNKLTESLQRWPLQSSVTVVICFLFRKWWSVWWGFFHENSSSHRISGIDFCIHAGCHQY